MTRILDGFGSETHREHVVRMFIEVIKANASGQSWCTQDETLRKLGRAIEAAPNDELEAIEDGMYDAIVRMTST